ncbi:non-ribosomal peptide synthetase [Streptoalloteichus hindustanus]|uniref:Amino acid adenylation domain-containing protein n=1 Tax=Streptoalloteichus hindustanus TaxID=2017 RepID=A0A1M5CHD5_STRHI|nr:non-ribosomal peptide synthetase [Streptoalloteichus hindustanus]SHF54128.1 amino acid adenylation domain-containing protein [Streptoalloteichus hindustanus]
MSERCLHEVFQSQVAARPEALALVCGDRAMTYQQLDQVTNQLARKLRQLGADRGTFVAIFCERSELPVVAVLACHKAGAAYVPVDTDLPEDRVRHVADELDVVVCVTEAAVAGKAERVFPRTAARLALDQEWASVRSLPDSSLRHEESDVDPSDLAYVIYTSGSTGRPKGVLTEHRHVTRFVASFNEVCGTGPDDRVYQGFPLSFDGSVEEIWMAFSNGSALVVPGRGAPRLGGDLARHLAELGITYFSTVPTLLATLVEDVPTLRTLVVSGEPCPPELVNRWARPGRRLLNVYGPTETTVNATASECVPGQPVSIGRPLPGYQVRVVGEDLCPVPPGAAGELLISGDTLARGYVSHPDLTDSRFVVLADEQRKPVRCYRTGDLGRWTESGDLEFLGRIDSQVKIRGYRVELTEIESVLLEHPAVSAACVRLVDHDGLQALAAYVVPARPGRSPNRNEILDLVERKLPAYMVPGYLDVVWELPRTTSGKADRDRLPDPSAPLVRESRTVVPPRTDLERTIAHVWSEVLGIAEVSVEDDFFTVLGGHSLVAARLAGALGHMTQHPVSVRDIYRFPTVRRLAAHLDPAAPPENQA